MKVDIAVGFISFALTTAISVLVNYFLKYLEIEKNDALVSSIVVFISLFIGVLFFWKKIKKRITIVALKSLLGGLKDHFGIIEVYDNFDEAKNDIKTSFSKAQDVSMFFQLGRSDIVGQQSLLFDEAMKRQNKDFKMRLLFSDRNSSALSEKEAKKRGSSYEEWTSVLSFVESSVNVLKSEGINISARRHLEPYLWRLFFFDNTVFFVPYLYKKQNHKKAPVFKLSSNDLEEGVIFHPLKKYFDDIWHKNKDREFCQKK